MVRKYMFDQSKEDSGVIERLKDKDPKKIIDYTKKGVIEMIKKATEKPREVEYIEFKGYENFEEVCNFMGYHFTGVTLEVNRRGEEMIKTDTGTYDTGTIFYRYFEVNTGGYKYDVISKDKFFRVYE